MRPLYILIFALIFAANISGCSCSKLPNIKDPHSLANRVGNFSPVKLDSDKAERRAAKNVTPLPQGTKDLDGRQEKFDPAFGAPEGETVIEVDGQPEVEVNPKAVKRVNEQRAATTSSKPTVAQGLPPGKFEPEFGSPRQSTPVVEKVAASQAQTFGKLAAGKKTEVAHVAKTQPLPPSIPVAKPVDSTKFGRGEGSFSPTTFAPTTPISDVPHPAGGGTPQGIGCPPAGMISLNNRTPIGFSNQAQTQTPFRFGPVPTTISSISRAPITAPIQQMPLRPYNLPTMNRYPAPSSPMPSAAPSSSIPNDSDIITAQAQHAQKAQVLVTARVKRLLPDDRKGNPHQRFLLQLSNGTTVLVAHNIDLAPYVPLHEGDFVTISGEYIWNEKGGVLHYTHHTTNSKHRGGYILYNRQTYQ